MELLCSRPGQRAYMTRIGSSYSPSRSSSSSSSSFLSCLNFPSRLHSRSRFPVAISRHNRFPKYFSATEELTGTATVTVPLPRFGQDATLPDQSNRQVCASLQFGYAMLIHS